VEYAHTVTGQQTAILHVKQHDKKSCKINSEKLYTETQREGMSFPEMLLHQMLTVASEHETAPASAGPARGSTGRRWGRRGEALVSQSHQIPLGENWKRDFRER